MVILVTGTPGAGKTTLVNYAHANNDDRFYDADEMTGLCEWREFETGRVLGLVSEHDQKTDDDWFKNHGWYWRKEKLAEFIGNNPDSIVCGSSENIAECYPLFDKIVVLKKTEDELLSNLRSPGRKNPFGKTTKQRQGFIEWQNYLITEAQNYRPVILDGNNTSETYRQIVGLISH